MKLFICKGKERYLLKYTLKDFTDLRMAMYLVSIYQMPEDFIEKHNEIVNYFIAYLEALMVEKEVIRCGCTTVSYTHLGSNK